MLLFKMEPRLSIVSIMRDEADLLPRYFDSIEQAFGRIGQKINVYITDTGSKDGSVELARARGAIVAEAGERFLHQLQRHEVKTINNEISDNIVSTKDKVFSFCDSRNFSNQQAETDWCLSLDICDIIVNADTDKIYSAMTIADNINKQVWLEYNNLPSNATADEVKKVKDKFFYGYTYTLLYGGLNTTPLVQSCTKLFNKNLPDNGWRCMVHEYFKSCGYSKNIPKSGDKDCLIIQHAQRSTVNHNYIKGLAYGFLCKPPADTHDFHRMLYYFARELQYRGYYGNDSGTNGAKKYLNKVCLSNVNWIKERSSSACLLAECYKKTDFERRRACYIRAIKLFPAWRQPYLALAEIAWDQEDYTGCMAMAEASLKVPNPQGNLFAEAKINYSTEPYRYMYIGATRLANNFIIWNEDASKLLDFTEEIEDKHGCGANVNIYGWNLMYNYYKTKDMARAKTYLQKCYDHDNIKYQDEYKKVFA